MLETLKKEGLFLPNGKFNPSFVKKFFNSITPERKSWYDSLLGESLSEKVYLLTQSLTQKPVCLNCGKPVKFISFGEGYREYCSVHCSTKHTVGKRKITNIERYGVEHPALVAEFRDKAKETCLKNWGVDNFFKRTDLIQEALQKKHGVTSPFKSPFFKEKAKNTSLKNWGVDHPMKNSSIRKKVEETNLLRYDSTCSVQNVKIQKEIRERRKENFYETVINSGRISHIAKPLFSLEEYSTEVEEFNKPIYYEWECVVCKTKFTDHIANGTLPRCPKCYPSAVQGTEERELATWLRTLLPNIEIIQNSRRIISSLEIDIYIPQYKLAIEMNEVFWHSELSTKGIRDEKYHLNKTQRCQEKGITLLHIFDFEWRDKQDIIKSIIESKLGIYKMKIGARKCIVKELTSEESREFLEENHIQGYAPASLRFGLFFEDELIAHLAVAKNRFKKGTYEIVRYVSKTHYSVQGGLSKLWERIKKELPNNFILVSYVDRRFFTGESNTKLGLSLSRKNRPSYYYTKDYKSILNRMAFQKKNLKKRLEFFNPKLTEWENMKNNKYDRIWDCGTWVFSKQM